jgi:hypothetical protein
LHAARDTSRDASLKGGRVQAATRRVSTSRACCAMLRDEHGRGALCERGEEARNALIRHATQRGTSVPTLAQYGTPNLVFGHRFT